MSGISDHHVALILFQGAYRLEVLRSGCETASLGLEGAKGIRHSAVALLDNDKVHAVVETTVHGVGKGDLPWLPPSIPFGCSDGLLYPIVGADRPSSPIGIVVVSAVLIGFGWNVHACFINIAPRFV